MQKNNSNSAEGKKENNIMVTRRRATEKWRKKRHKIQAVNDFVTIDDNTWKESQRAVTSG